MITEFTRCPVCNKKVRVKGFLRERYSPFTIIRGRFIGDHFKRSYDWRHCPGSSKEIADATS